jgi:hypothetical protein
MFLKVACCIETKADKRHDFCITGLIFYIEKLHIIQSQLLNKITDTNVKAQFGDNL